jgi:hypothetical protein
MQSVGICICLRGSTAVAAESGEKIVQNAAAAREILKIEVGERDDFCYLHFLFLFYLIWGSA